MQSKLTSWLSSIESTANLKELEEIKTQLLGKTGEISTALKGLGSLDPEIRKIQGAQINLIRDEVVQALKQRQCALEEQAIAAKLAEQKLDMTLPSKGSYPTADHGVIHPLTRLMNEIRTFFHQRGFTFAQGPEIEDDWHNFDALNIPEHHPARQNHDTFYMHVNSPVGAIKRLLRTHTSTVQIRTMSQSKPPLRLISMGRVYRSDDLDATHTPMFHQVEGLVIDRNIHMGHLKGLLQEFSSALFQVENAPIRMRPSFFPFTEPSAEVDVACTKRDGKLIMGEGGHWMELLGCGMVHPQVLDNCGIDPTQFQGFAFGMGIERLCMIKNGITDIRNLYEGDEHWLRHYGCVA